MPVSTSQFRASSGAYQNKLHDNCKHNATQGQGVSPNRSAEMAERFGSRVNRVVNSHIILNRAACQHTAPREDDPASRLMWLSQVRIDTRPLLAPAIVSGKELSPSFSTHKAHPDNSGDGSNAKLSPVADVENNKVEQMHLWENKRPKDLSSEIKLTQQAVSEKLIRIKKITSLSMLPVPQEGIAKFVLTPTNELFTLEAASGVPRNTPKYYTHASITGEPVLAAGWVYPDPYYPHNYIFSNLSGHYKTNLGSLENLKKALEKIGLCNTQYRTKEYFQTPGGMISSVERDLMDPKWSRPAPTHPWVL